MSKNDKHQFNRGPRLACPEYGKIRRDDPLEYLKLPQYHSHKDLSQVRDGPFGHGVTCPQVNPSTSPRRGPTWNRLAGNVMPLWPLSIYLSLAITTSGNKKSQISLKEIKWNGLTLSHTSIWSRGLDLHGKGTSACSLPSGQGPESPQ